MDKHNVDKSKVDFDSVRVLTSLSYNQMLNILSWLCKDEELEQRIILKAKQFLMDIDQAKIEQQVFQQLNGIDVMEFFERSGKTYYGYNDPNEEAGYMLEEAIEPLMKSMQDCRSLGLKEVERKYCQGIYYGLLHYAMNGSNEFRDWVPDDMYILADSILEEWKEHNNTADWVEGSALTED